MDLTIKSLSIYPTKDAVNGIRTERYLQYSEQRIGIYELSKEQLHVIMKTNNPIEKFAQAVSM